MTAINSSSSQLINNRVQQYSLHSQAMEVGSLKFAWKIKNFSNLEDERIYSDIFSLGPYKWKIEACLNGDKENGYLSLYLHVADSESLPSGWSVKAKFSFTIVDQIDNKSSIITESDDTPDKFSAQSGDWGYSKVMSLKELHDFNKGYLVEDTCKIKADVTIYGDDYLESHVERKETYKDLHRAKNATEEDIDAFFGDLNSVIFPKKVVSLEEEAKKALAIIKEALSIVPAEVNNPGRMAQLTNAFDILSSLKDCSVLTLDQKERLLSMKDNFIALPERAATAGKNQKLFAEKKLVKKTLDDKLGRYLIEFERIKSENKQNELNIVTVQERVDSFLTQIGEMKKKREDLFSKQKELFEVCLELKAELDVLVKKWPEYEEKLKAGQEEEKIVSMEWDKMKELVFSLNT